MSKRFYPKRKETQGASVWRTSKERGTFFTGTLRFSCVCQYTKGARTLTNRFTSVTTIEITKLSQTRIEGRTVIPSKDSKLDCQRGDYTKPPNEWEAFVWMPE